MQNKGLIRLFAILFGAVSIYQLSFTLITSKIESDADRYAYVNVQEGIEDYLTQRERVTAAYLDSVSDLPILGFTSYADAKNKELNKGLDLKGGINVTLQISVKDILKGLAADSKNPAFNAALLGADEATKQSDANYVELFFEAFESDTQAKLASPDIFANKNLSDEINFEMTNDEVKPILRRKIDESIVSAFEVLRERIDGFGVTQPNIQRVGSSGRILVELPGARDINRAQELLSSTAQLEFWETIPQDEQGLSQFLFAADSKIAEITKRESLDEVEALLENAADSVSNNNPLLSKLIAPAQGSNAFVRAAVKDTAEIGGYLRNNEVQTLLPTAIKFTKFAWQRVGIDAEIVELYALKSNREGLPRISGDVVSNAQDTFDQFGKPAVSMTMNTKGAREWERMTGDVYQNQTGIAIVLDNKVYTAPGVSSGPISGGRSEITGDFTINETKDIANVLRAGKLPASAEIVQSEIVGPSLGQEAINSGFISFMIAMAFVLLWMIFYYGRAGFFADIALILNIVLIFGVLTSLGAVLTLPGIAGIVLTIGMSVDANVLVFERIREELRKGKGLALSISDGFSNALSSILDANMTTGLTAAVLFLFGSGPIKGFATTLLIGILTSLFTAIFVTRIFIEGYLFKKGRQLSFSTALTANLFSKARSARHADATLCAFTPKSSRKSTLSISQGDANQSNFKFKHNSEISQ